MCPHPSRRFAPPAVATWLRRCTSSTSDCLDFSCEKCQFSSVCSSLRDYRRWRQTVGFPWLISDVPPGRLQRHWSTPDIYSRWGYERSPNELGLCRVPTADPTHTCTSTVVRSVSMVPAAARRTYTAFPLPWPGRPRRRRRGTSSRRTPGRGSRPGSTGRRGLPCWWRTFDGSSSSPTDNSPSQSRRLLTGMSRKLAGRPSPCNGHAWRSLPTYDATANLRL